VSSDQFYKWSPKAVEFQAFFAPKTPKGELGKGNLHVDLGKIANSNPDF